MRCRINSTMNLPEFKAVIFDLDGTLLNTLGDLADAVNYAMRAKSYPERTVEEVRRFIGNGIAKLISRSVPPDTSQDDIQEALSLFTDYYGSHMRDKTQPYEGIMNLLAGLREQGLKTAVVSNKHDSAAKALVKSFFGDLIDYTQGKTDGIAAKPDPGSLLKAAESVGADIKSVLYVGDSDVDVLTAHNAGCVCAGVVWGYRDESLLKKSGADFIVHSADELYFLIKN